jgi:hypothetical protein
MCHYFVEGEDVTLVARSGEWLDEGADWLGVRAKDDTRVYWVPEWTIGALD